MLTYSKLGIDRKCLHLASASTSCRFLGYTSSAFLKDCLFSTFIIKKVNDGTRKTMKVCFPVNKGFLKGHFGLTSCILFHEWNEWKSMQRVRPKWPWKKPLFKGIWRSLFWGSYIINEFSNKCGTYMSLLFQGFVKSIWPFEFEPMHEGRGLVLELGMYIDKITVNHMKRRSTRVVV